MQKQKQKQNKTHAKPLQESKGKFKRREKMNALSCPLSLSLDHRLALYSALKEHHVEITNKKQQQQQQQQS